jgi:hypothetical protein
MPNWCENRVVVKHNDPKMIEKFVKSFNEEKVGQTFRPEPDYSKVPVYPTFPDIGGKDPNKPVDPKRAWWDWRVQNWGVKWDVGNDEYDPPIEIDSETTEVEVFFLSPWSPPRKLYEYMTEEHGFQIYTEYFEPGMMFIGIWSSSGIDASVDVTREDLETISPDEFPLSAEVVRECVEGWKKVEDDAA